uniref:sphingomyelin phosphodiesterase n=1 Tax=Corethrella appendiculata TaxID=1370023 RepID=U5EWI2_9DIPT
MFIELSVLTLNIWGIPYISKDRDIRTRAIGDVLGSGNYDIVSLQEVWSENDYQYLRKRVEAVLPYAHYFYSGVFGSGLCIFSKYPIVSSFFHAWSVNGYVHRIQHGDWFGGKGVGLCKILVNGQHVNVYAAHLHAEYNRDCDDYMTHRVIQAFDTAQFIETTRGDSILQILAGDLNTEPGDLAYRVLTTSSFLTDTFDKKTLEFHGTNECAKNSYTEEKAAQKLPLGKRIDYIMYRFGNNYDGKILEYRLPLADRIPAQNISYSDHEAVYSKIIMKRTSSKMNDLHNLISSCSNGNNKNEYSSDINSKEYHNNLENIAALKESIAICNESLKQLESHKRHYALMAIAIIVVLLNMLEISAPYGLKTACIILKFSLCAFTIFLIFMATIWNVMEKHGILAGKLSMEISLRNLQDITSNLNCSNGGENAI